MRKIWYHRQVVKVWPAGSKLLCLRASREIKTMIQDIQPHQYDNRYQPQLPDRNSFVLYCEEHSVLVKQTPDGITFPRFPSWNASMKIFMTIVFIFFQ